MSCPNCNQKYRISNISDLVDGVELDSTAEKQLLSDAKIPIRISKDTEVKLEHLQVDSPSYNAIKKLETPTHYVSIYLLEDVWYPVVRLHKRLFSIYSKDTQRMLEQSRSAPL